MMEDELFQIPATAPRPKDKNFKARKPIWTECKAKLIERYLFYFVQITYHGTYIDAFAGPQEPDKHDMWSAKLVIESRPRWLRHFYLFELDKEKVKTIHKMWDEQPPRIKEKGEPRRTREIYSGDFNENIHKMLAENPIPDKEATFCLLDQRTLECDWDSVKTLAAHKKSGNKIELFYFFAEGWMNRSIKALKYEKEKRMQRWWGGEGWEDLLKMSGVVRAQYVCEKFKKELGYKHVNPFPIYKKKDGGRIMYYMIHASDHEDAPMLMSRAYEKALDIKETLEQTDMFIQKIPKGPAL